MGTDIGTGACLGILGPWPLSGFRSLAFRNGNQKLGKRRGCFNKSFLFLVWYLNIVRRHFGLETESKSSCGRAASWPLMNLAYKKKKILKTHSNTNKQTNKQKNG